MRLISKTKLKCENCGHEWLTKSKLIFVSCPSCGHKVHNKLSKRNK